MAHSLASSSNSGHSASLSARRKPTTFTIADELSVEEHGRTFNAYRENKYFLPNDGEEQDRLDLQHKMWLLLLKGQLALTPLCNDKNKDPGDVLDIGTGTGIWAKQFAREHPNSRVVGTDLSLIQTSENLPPNCSFVREDSEELWVHDHPFDYIHWRLMCSCFNDIKGMFTRIYDNLRPGGWAEFQDAVFEPVGEDPAADSFVRNSNYARYFQGLCAGGLAHGRDFRAPYHFKEWMIEAGFVDVTKLTILVPLNAWPLNPEDKIIGNWFCMNVLKFLDGSSKLLEAGGMPREEIPGFLDKVRDDLTDLRLRGYTEHYVYYGRRPETPSGGVPSNGDASTESTVGTASSKRIKLSQAESTQ